MKIIADSAIPFLQGVLEPWAEVRYLPGAEIAPEEVRDADALLIRTRTRCDERLLGGSRVRLIATATIGFDHIDTAWCAAHGIRVCTAAGCNARGVLQWVGAVLAHLARTQGWQPAGRTLGVVGVGTRRIARKGVCRNVGFPGPLLRPAARGARTLRLPAAGGGRPPSRHPDVPHAARRHDAPHGRRRPSHG